MTRISESPSVLSRLGHLQTYDRLLELGVGEVDVQEQAPAAQRLGQLAGRIRGEHDERPLGGADRAELRDRHLELAEHLEQQALDLDIGLVGLVDQQHRRPRCGSR